MRSSRQGAIKRPRRGCAAKVHNRHQRVSPRLPTFLPELSMTMTCPPRIICHHGHEKEVSMNYATLITPERLRAFFHPRSIALVGATDRSRWSIYTYQNLKTFGYPDSIFCVNPNYEVVHGEPAAKRLSDIQEPVDLAFIMVPTHQVYP